MKFKAITFSVLFLSIGFSGISQELPEVSSKATVKQRVGLTDIEINYSRPNVRKREIFGALVPYDKVWRLGANEATTFETSSDINFEYGGTLPAGKYALFATPGRGSWLFHFNRKHDQWGAYDYKKEEDALFIKAKIDEPTHFEESMSIRFADVTTQGGKIIVQWGQTKVIIPFTVPTKKLAIQNIQKAIKEGKDLDKVYANAAEYYSEQLNDNKMALEYANESLKKKETLQGYFTKASILFEMGNKSEAIKNGEKAEKMAKDAGKDGWAGYIRKNIDKWSK